MKMTSQLIVVAERRQRILDFLNSREAAHQGQTPFTGVRMDRIGAYLRGLGDVGNFHNTIRTMGEWGELRFEGITRARRYFALQTVTRSAEESLAQRLKNTAHANEKRHRAAVLDSVKIRGKVHHPGEHPIPNQGGQGAVRPHVHINCGQSY